MNDRMTDSDFGRLEATNRRPRMTAHAIADSTVVKLLQPIILSIMIPLVTWGGGKFLERMDRIETSINYSNTVSATNELRLRRVEVADERRESDLRAMSERINNLTLRAELLDARVSHQK